MKLETVLGPFLTLLVYTGHSVLVYIVGIEGEVAEMNNWTLLGPFLPFCHLDSTPVFHSQCSESVQGINIIYRQL